MRCLRLRSLFGCVSYDAPKPHSCALVGDVSDGAFVVLVPELEVAADELAVVAEGLTEPHPVAAAWFALRAFASKIAAAAADGSRVLGRYLVALPAVAAARLAADANPHTHLAAQRVERVLGVAVEGPLYVSHVSPHSDLARLP